LTKPLKIDQIAYFDFGGKNIYKPTKISYNMSVAIIKNNLKYSLNLEKYKQVILYLVEKLDGKLEGKKKFMKLLYYVEFDFFEKYGEPFTSETFEKYPMGPFAANFKVVLEDLEKSGDIKVAKEKKVHHHKETEIFMLNKTQAYNFEPEEKNMIDRVIRLYGQKTGKYLEELTHSEAPWNAVGDYEVIDPELSYYRDTQF
jgi:uncharacterized phage-associated protein